MKTKLAGKVKLIAAEYKFGDFLRNLVAVILGIVITFVGSDMISEHQTQQEVKKALQLVKSELLINRNAIMQIIKTYSNTKAASERFLFFNEAKKKLQEDFFAVPEIKRHFSDNQRIDWDFLFKHLEAAALIKQIPQIQSTDTYYTYIENIDDTIAAIDKEYN